MLEELRELLKNQNLNIAVGLVKGTHLLDDGSVLKVTVQVWPEDREIIARMSWDSCGPEAGIYMFPVIGDMVLIGFTENEDQAFIIRKLSSLGDKIPESAKDGSLVLRALVGKKAFLTSNEKICLSKGDGIPTENLVLGQIFKTFAAALLTEISKVADENSKEIHIGNLGLATTVPQNASAYTAVKTAVDNLKSSPIDDNGILSDLAFTEKK